MRKSIFDIVSDNLDIKSDLNRINRIANLKGLLYEGDYFIQNDYNLFEFVNKYCFKSWKQRGRLIDLDDFLYTIKFDELTKQAVVDFNAFLSFIEVIYNLWYLSDRKIKKSNSEFELNFEMYSSDDFNHLKDIMDTVLEQYNHTAHLNSNDEYVLIVEDKPEVTAVSEILPDQLALNVIKYNHRQLKGNIELKKSILISFGHQMESQRSNLEKNNKWLSEDIFFMLNNMNLRHNNIDESNKTKYKKYVAKMSDNELEKWYDELYQMILLAFLTLDNVERSKNVEDLKKRITVEEIANEQTQNAHAEQG